MKQTLYFALVTTECPSIVSLPDCETFEAASLVVDGLQNQGEVVPWIFGRQDLINLKSEIENLLKA